MCNNYINTSDIFYKKIYLFCFFGKSRLLDAAVDQVDRNLGLTLVLEYIDQDLSTYLSKVPASGLRFDCIKVQLLHVRPVQKIWTALSFNLDSFDYVIFQTDFHLLNQSLHVKGNT